MNMTAAVSNTTFFRECIIGFRTGLAHVLWYFQHEAGKFRNMISSLIMHKVGKDKEGVIIETENAELNELKVIGVGFGRTGTYSLKLALDQLGFSTLHTQHMYETPEILDMWVEKVFQPAIDAKELSMGNPDFDIITSHGFRAIVDLPAAFYFGELNKKFPDAKFILTTREDSETWFKSFESMIISVAQVTESAGNVVDHVNHLALYLRWLTATLNKDKEILSIPVGKGIPSPKKEEAMTRYEKHNTDVKQTIPQERLLEYNIKEGWEPLCRFLQVADCPAAPFPNTNSAVSLKAQAFSAVATFFTLTFLMLLPIFKKARKVCFSSRRLLLKKQF